MLRRKEFILYLTTFLIFVTGIFIFMPAVAQQGVAKQEPGNEGKVKVSSSRSQAPAWERKSVAKQELGNEGKGELSNEEGGDIQGMIKALEERQKVLDRREEALKKEEEKLNMLKNSIELSLKQYSAMRDRLQKELTTNGNRNNQSQQDIGHIVKIYESMSPEEAAQRIEKMDHPMAVELLSKIKSKQAGKIMGAISAEKAALLTEKIAAKNGARNGATNGARNGATNADR